MDTLTPEQRSERMSRVRGRDTKPEMVVRRLVHAMGYRYRLHRSDLPGKPDLVFPSRRKVIFVHGCFWHWHDVPTCRGARMPKSRTEYWSEKLQRNIDRDERNLLQLRAEGWGALIVWECEVKHKAALTARLRAFLD